MEAKRVSGKVVNEDADTSIPGEFLPVGMRQTDSTGAWNAQAEKQTPNQILSLPRQIEVGVAKRKFGSSDAKQNPGE